MASTSNTGCNARTAAGHGSTPAAAASATRANAPVRCSSQRTTSARERQRRRRRIALELRMQQARRMEALGTLAGGIAHDFNNLLGAILGFGGMARQLAEDGSPIRRHIDRVLQAGNRAQVPGAERPPVRPLGPTGRTPVNVQCVVEEAIVILSPSLQEGVSVETRLRRAGCHGRGRCDRALPGRRQPLHERDPGRRANPAECGSCSPRCSVDRPRLAAARRTRTRTPRPARHRGQRRGHAAGDDREDLRAFLHDQESRRRDRPRLSVVHGIVKEMAGAIDVRVRARRRHASLGVAARHCSGRSRVPGVAGDAPRTRRGRS